MGTKARPFYRVVVAQSTAARDGAFVEVIGTYNPLTQPHLVKIKGDRALHWLLEGAQPTETVAYLLKQEGVLDEFFAKRPKAKSAFKFLDKRTAATTKKTVVEAVAVAPAAPAPAPTPEPVAEAAPEPAADVQAEVPVEEAAAETPAEAVAEAPAEVPAESPDAESAVDAEKADA